MQYATMMTDEMVTALIIEDVTYLEREAAMIADVLPVLIVEIGVALTMNVDPTQFPDPNRGEVPNMIEEKAQPTSYIPGWNPSFLVIIWTRINFFLFPSS